MSLRPSTDSRSLVGLCASPLSILVRLADRAGALPRKRSPILRAFDVLLHVRPVRVGDIQLMFGSERQVVGLAVLIQSGARLTGDAQNVSVPVFLDNLTFIPRAHVKQAVGSDHEPRDEMFRGN